MPDIRISTHYKRGPETPYVVAHIRVPHGKDPQDFIDELIEEGDYLPKEKDEYFEFVSPPTSRYSGKTTFIKTSLVIDVSFKVVNDEQQK